MNKFWIIAFDVYRKYVKSASFLILTLTPVIAVAGFSLAMEVIRFSAGVEEIAVASEDESLFTAFQGAVPQSDTRRFFLVSSSSAARNLLKEKDIKAYLFLEKRDAALYGTVYTNTALITINTSDIQETLNALQRELTAGMMRLSPEDAARLNTPARFETVHLDFSSGGTGRETPDYSFYRQMIVSLLVAVIFMGIMMYASIITTEIASEKGTRIMEILLSSAKAETHFYAKLTGIGLVCLTGVFFYAAVCAGIYPYIKNAEWMRAARAVPFSELFGGLFIFTLPITLFSVGIYMILAALSGSLVSRIEEASQAVQPMLWFSMIGYLGSILFNNDPEHIMMRIMSYMPFWSAFAMPARLARNGAALWEALMSLGLLVITGVILLMFSARMYKSNVLMYSGAGLLKSLKLSLAELKTEKR
ncbi:MAG: ABC transporter permease [Treponema sp.]|jgi:ABC-2 type transport system permease protein|nr:ABC transporter permease [Treponema sp.]